MVNRVTLVGNVGRDPELRRLSSGAPVAKFSVATSESFQDRDGNAREQTEWHDVVLWRALAERAEAHLRKGMLVYVEGKLSTRTWEDREGNSRKTTEVVGSFLRILNRRERDDRGGDSGRREPPATPAPEITPTPAAEAPLAAIATPKPPDGDTAEGDGLPF